MGIATEKQINFLRTLSTERVTDAKQDAMLASIFAGTRTTTSQEASIFITILLDQPRKPSTAPAPARSGYAAATAALADVPVSFYAIPAGYVSAQNVDLHGNDYLFVRVRNMSRGGKRMSRVVGSPDAPRYMGMSPAVVEHVANLVKDRAVEFAGLWHEVSGRCGKCNALLTDRVSREKGFGPDCRRQLGIA
ncbi:hypothetical protein SEA_A3WALLY_384 [Microbacterium phage A3Wally]|nr:hypothetical protein SEA_A3WALLY_31 [Microbacterium phage A3Wally]QWY84191.1 hypothetical protein SEA_A3WALLY_384 [Microbacterium phage A3Wally]